MSLDQQNSVHDLSLGFVVKTLFIFRISYFAKFSPTTFAAFRWITSFCLLCDKGKSLIISNIPST